MSNSNQNKFNFFIPASFEKAKKGDKNVVRVKGVASTSTTSDSDGETLFPEGFDYSPLLEKGFLNWDHQQKGRPSAIIGEPDVAKVINGGKDFYIEGFLYPDSIEAQQVAELAEVLEANSSKRRLGYSIEGQVIERDALNPKKVLKARITGVAITPCPKNPNTLLSLIKGEYSDAFVKGEPLEDKAMTAEQASEDGLLPESVEGTKRDKKKKKVKTVARTIEKSEVYDLIVKNYSTDFAKAKRIFHLIEEVNKKLYNMADQKITEDAIRKAFDFLEKAASDDIVDRNGAVVEEGEGEDIEEIASPELDKNKKSKPEKKDVDDKSLEKAIEMCKGLLKDDKKTNDEAVEEMIKGGFSLSVSQNACAQVVAEMSSLKENGGQISPANENNGNESEQQSLKKGEENSLNIGELIKSTFGETNDLIKGMQDDFSNKFTAVGTILKNMVDANTSLNTQLEDIKKSNATLSDRLETLEKEPTPTKSLRNVNAIDRFEKSQGQEDPYPKGTSVFNIKVREDRENLLDLMDAEIQKSRSEGRTPSAILEKAVAELEIMKSLPREVLPILRTMHVAVEG